MKGSSNRREKVSQLAHEHKQTLNSQAINPILCLNCYCSDELFVLVLSTNYPETWLKHENDCPIWMFLKRLGPINRF